MKELTGLEFEVEVLKAVDSNYVKVFDKEGTKIAVPGCIVDMDGRGRKTGTCNIAVSGCAKAFEVKYIIDITLGAFTLILSNAVNDRMIDVITYEDHYTLRRTRLM